MVLQKLITFSSWFCFAHIKSMLSSWKSIQTKFISLLIANKSTGLTSFSKITVFDFLTRIKYFFSNPILSLVRLIMKVIAEIFVGNFAPFHSYFTLLILLSLSCLRFACIWCFYALAFDSITDFCTELGSSMFLGCSLNLVLSRFRSFKCNFRLV